jgi:hypothetical protein
MYQIDPFASFRSSTPLYESVNGADQRSLRLVAIDVAHFANVAADVISRANASGWRVFAIERDHPGGVRSIEVSPRR